MTFGTGDLVSICSALIFLALGLLKPSNRNGERIALLLANGLAAGTMILILVSPVPQLLGSGANFLDIVMKEEKLSLWWAAAVASVNLIRVLL